MRFRLACFLALSASGLLAQSQPAFEVASVRPSAGPIPGVPPMFGQQRTTPDTLTARHTQLVEIMRRAYGVVDEQLVGAPAWIREQRFDIVVKAAAPASDAELWSMVRPLLEDRFKFKYHREPREVSGLALVVGKNGPKLTPSQGGSDQISAAGGVFKGQNVPISRLAGILSSVLRRPVIDATSLEGTYDFSVDPRPYAGQGPPDLQGMVITAMQEELGLKAGVEEVRTAGDGGGSHRAAGRELTQRRLAQTSDQSGGFVTRYSLRGLLVILALNVALASGLRSQERPAAPVFEVAAIKPHNPAEPGGGFSFQHGRLTISNTVLRVLIMSAYSVKDFQISGGPNWIDGERFDVLAQGPDNSDPRDLNLMLRALLADRFRLTFHREIRESSIYALVVAKSGPKVRSSAPDAQYSMRMGPAGMSATKMSIHDFADTVAGYTRRSVVDRTGLDGDFDFKFDWSPQDPNSPSIFTALQEQLGLKLEAEKGPTEFLIIDHAEMPSAN